MFSFRKLVSHKGWWILAGLWFAAWHLLFTWEVWQDPTRLVPGHIGDNTVMLWNLGWVRYALSHGQTGFWFTNAYYPDGFLFLYGTHTWLDGLFYWLASPLLPGGIDGTILWANISLLGATISTGLLIMACLRTWGINQWSVLLMSASMAAFCWFRMFALTGHYHFFATQYMLLALWFLSKGLRDYRQDDLVRGRIWTLMAGLAMGVSFLNDQTMCVFAAILGGLAILSLWGGDSPKRRQMFFESVGLYYGASLLSASIHLIPIALAIADGKFVYKVETGGPRLVDASSMLIPPEWHLAGPYIEVLRGKYGLKWSEGTYLGIVPVLLFIVMCVGSIWYIRRRKSGAPQYLRYCLYSTLAAATFLIFALGDKLVIGSHQFFTLPGIVLKELPIVNNIRLPQRWVWPAQLCIAFGGASVFSGMINRFFNRRHMLICLAILLAVISGIEGKKYPALAPTDYRLDPFIAKPQLVKAVQDRYKSGGVLVMPIKPYFPYGNILQFEWGYDIPVTMTYNARMPFLPDEVPWQGNGWSQQAGKWLRDKQVSIVVFPAHKGRLDKYSDWITRAKTAVPGLIVLNGAGQEIKN